MKKKINKSHLYFVLALMNVKISRVRRSTQFKAVQRNTEIKVAIVLLDLSAICLLSFNVNQTDSSMLTINTSATNCL